MRQEEEVKDKADDDIKKSDICQADKERIAYFEELENAKIKDAALKENLAYMLEAGFSNFSVNLNLLKRNKNDLTIAMNLICNNLVTDSVFGQ